MSLIYTIGFPFSNKIENIVQQRWNYDDVFFFFEYCKLHKTDNYKL